MKKLLETPLGRLRIVAFTEGLSFLLLTGLAVPMKYIYGYEHATREIGMVHGLLFMTYIYLLYPVREKYKWSWTEISMAFAAALLPFGTLVAEYKWFRKIEV